MTQPANSNTQIKFLAPEIGNVNKIATSSTFPPFHPSRVQTLEQLSQAILKDAMLKQLPIAVALGYWLRKSHLLQLKKHYQTLVSLSPESVYRPKGTVLHITPANVDTLFLYSWAIAYLCGNNNLIRLSTRQSEVTRRLLMLLNQMMKAIKPLAASNVFLSYRHEVTITQMLSDLCDMRVIWGGNETIAAVRSVPLQSHAGEIVFGSKFSYSIIKTATFKRLSPKQLKQIARKIYNDIFWFDQFACSSPHIIFWLGDTIPIAEFNQLLSAEIKHNNFTPTPSQNIQRLNFSYDLAAEHHAYIDTGSKDFVTVLYQRNQKVKKEVCGAGLIQHVPIDSLKQIVAFSDRGDQTLTHLGLTQKEQVFLAQNCQGIKRIVSLGKALNFHHIWDGMDLISQFLETVNLSE